MHGLLSTDMDSMNGLNSFNYIDRTPGAEIEERVITTPEGPEPITTLRKRFPRKSLQGCYDPNTNTSSENKELMYPWLSVRIHEDDHERYGKFYTSGIPDVDELTNRKVADAHYNKLARKHGLPLVDSAGEFEKQLKNYLERNSTPDEVEQTMQAVKEWTDHDFKRVMQIPIDIEKDYKNDIPHRDLLTGEFKSPKHSTSKLNGKLSYLV